MPSTSENTAGKGFNVYSYNSPQMDDLLQRGNSVPQCDPPARRTIYTQVYNTLAQDVPAVFLFAPPNYLAAQPRVLLLKPSSFAGEYWNLNNWQVRP